MDQAPLPEDEVRNLRFLRRLVTALTATMIFGLLAIVGLLVIRFSAPGSPILPDELRLPEGAAATAFTQGSGWYAIVTDRNEILIYDRQTGALRQTIEIAE